MQDRLTVIESRLAAIERRLSALEEASAVETGSGGAGFEPSLSESFIADFSAHLGRVLLIFGGAYLLRAITDHQFVPTGIGIMLGATYALVWLFLAYRQAVDRQRRAVAAFYAGTSVILALPLIVEAISRFELLSGRQALLALAVYVSLGLTVAIRRDLRTLGWLVTLGGIVTAFAVIVLTHVAVATTVLLLMLGLASLWIVYGQHWIGLQWFGAVGANAGVIAVVVFANSDQWTVADRTVAILAGGLLASYLLSFAFRTHGQGKSIGAFEVVQSAIATGVVAIAVAQSQSPGVAGALGTALGICAYGLAFSPETHRLRSRNFYFYSALGLLLVTAGTGMMLPLTAAAAVWALLAVAMAWWSGRTGHVVLSLHCTSLLIAAGVGSGVLGAGLQALARDPATGWPVPEPMYALIALATVACLFLPVAQHSSRWGQGAGIPQLAVLALSVWEVGGLIVLYLAPLLADADATEPDRGVLAALRTAVLSASAVTLAVSSLHRRWPEARWLIYPVLVLVGVKLFAEDFPNGRPDTLFVALAFVGGALLLVAKLSAVRKSTAAAADARRDA